MGKKYTGKTGVWKKQMDPNVYAELLTTVVRTEVLDEEIKRGTCLKDRPMLTVMRSEPDGQSMRMQSLNSGCEGHADLATTSKSSSSTGPKSRRWLRLERSTK